jgi:rhodanese-related sulfurtransferase
MTHEEQDPMSISVITAAEAQSLIKGGAVLIDVRDADEHARERIPTAKLIPLAQIGSKPLPEGAKTVVFHCRSGNRTGANAARLAGAAGSDAYILEGGLDAWKRAGLPVISDRGQPLELMRQVQMAAGLLVLVSVVLGSTVSAAFYFLAGFVGAGLVFAGATGTCGMAHLLRLMPWNRRMASPS